MDDVAPVAGEHRLAHDAAGADGLRLRDDLRDNRLREEEEGDQRALVVGQLPATHLRPRGASGASFTGEGPKAGQPGIALTTRRNACVSFAVAVTGGPPAEVNSAMSRPTARRPMTNSGVAGASGSRRSSVVRGAGTGSSPV